MLDSRLKNGIRKKPLEACGYNLERMGRDEDGGEARNAYLLHLSAHAPAMQGSASSNVLNPTPTQSIKSNPHTPQPHQDPFGPIWHLSSEEGLPQEDHGCPQRRLTKGRQKKNDENAEM